MEITDLSWNENLSKRFNNPLLPRSIRGLILENLDVEKQRYY